MSFSDLFSFKNNAQIYILLFVAVLLLWVIFCLLYNFPTNIEQLPLELGSTNWKWLILSLYKTPSLRSKIFISEVIKALTFYSEIYDNILLMSDFNMTPENDHLKDFTDSNDFKNLIKGPTYLKSTSPTSFWQTEKEVLWNLQQTKQEYQTIKSLSTTF